MGLLTMDQILEKIDELPTLSHITLEVFKLTGNDHSSVEELAAVIAQDQVLAARVLRMANSSYYGYARKVFTIKEAIMVLGFRTIRSLVMAVSVNTIVDRDIQGYDLAKGMLWKHSMATALIARAIRARSFKSDDDLAFMGGLIHDLGKVVLNTFMAEHFQMVLEVVNSNFIPFMDAEEIVLGFNHAVVGAQVAEKWNLPIDLVEAISCHHKPSLATINPELSAVIHVADSLAMVFGFGLGCDGLLYPYDAEAAKILSLDEKQLYNVASEVVDKLLEADAMFSA